MDSLLSIRLNERLVRKSPHTLREANERELVYISNLSYKKNMKKRLKQRNL